MTMVDGKVNFIYLCLHNIYLYLKLIICDAFRYVMRYPTLLRYNVLFASQKYPILSGTNVARDYVEFPSQFNEHWALYPTVLKHYAVHYKTGEPIPQSLVDKIKNASSFNKGYSLTELLAAASLDMQWHKLAADYVVQDADVFEKMALHTTGLDLPQVPTRYRSTYFLHIWGNGYSAGYYAYLWTKMM